ncbi:sugar ABC transporter ATP-binding protein [Homoserinibacter sp. YIM 151385]|uniref:sugar ABC transporter ATP-binding protein n=1 Tax=Homoserinibacter sp. YIM 151385 TaxID=2985506 RepID=UPI0022F0CBA7|nr:sugar ABC transporter ATP-binding protein [Homoserinibacter sp. YIM 151385]WBU39260.1 sugar ABC transporter ATP-binding protein [Homoserinibacter sp. YIM 151385]
MSPDAPTTATAPRTTAPRLEMRGIHKSFPGTHACKGTRLEVAAGEVHCLLGENGAGKSTLMKILAGSYLADEGEILVDGAPVTLTSPVDGIAAGIAVIYQELDLFPDLTVAQNLFLGHSPSRAGLVLRGRRTQLAKEYLARVGATFSPDAVVGRLPIADQQLTAIARALTVDARIIVMDEPTATLGADDVEKVFAVVRGLRAEGRSVIYISHRLDEVTAIGDRITVLRDGRDVARHEVATTTSEQWIADMIGEKQRELTEVNTRPVPSGEPVLEIERAAIPGLIDIEGIQVRAGEIVGLAGLGGAGRTTLLSAIYGARPATTRLRLDGRPLRIRGVRDATAAGFGLVPESRKTEGLMLGLSVSRNAGIASIDTAPWLAPHARGRRISQPVLERLGVRHSSPHQAVGQLSGGNQQKVVLAKWLARGIRVLLLDEPTRGLDIGAKADLYRQVHAVAEQGAAVLVASSELSELMANADRIIVLHEGRKVGEFDPRTASEETITHAVISGEKP